MKLTCDLSAPMSRTAEAACVTYRRHRVQPCSMAANSKLALDRCHRGPRGEARFGDAIVRAHVIDVDERAG